MKFIIKIKKYEGVNVMGKKVKTLATVYLVVSLIIGGIGIISSLGSLGDLDCIGYATIFGGAYYSSSLEELGNEALSGILTIIPSVVLIITGIVTYIPLSAFGELVENTNTNMRKLTEIENILSEKKENDKKFMVKISNTLEEIDYKLKDKEEK